MIVPVLKEIVETYLKFEGKPIPFGNGRKPMANLMDAGGPFVWAYPIMESDNITAGGQVGTSYDCIIGFNIPGEEQPGIDIEQSYIDQARALCLIFEQKLTKHDAVKEIKNIKREPFYRFLAENLYGMNIRLTIVSRYPYGKC